MKYILIFLIFVLNINAALILVSNKNINYKEAVNKNNLSFISTNDNIKCNMFDMELLEKEQYQARHFIFKNKAICKKDLEKIVINKIQYDFGNILIQRNGKVVSENKDYIKIKNYDGSIEKIYKNGQ